MLQSCMSECVLSVCMCCLCDVSAICTMFTIYMRKARARERQNPHSRFSWVVCVCGLGVPVSGLGADCVIAEVMKRCMR